VYGIEAINAHNGWAMAIAGALIVMSGLSVLSFIISQLHKVLALTDNRKKNKDIDQSSVPKPIPATTADHDLSNLEGSLTCYCDETARLGSAFTLQDLFTVFQECDFPHPHLTIRSLKEEGFLIPADQDKFSWKK
jgi:hypothetical protein